MNRTTTPELATFYILARSSGLRREAAEEVIAREIRCHAHAPARRHRMQRALGRALVGLGRAIAGEPGGAGFDSGLSVTRESGRRLAGQPAGSEGCAH